jgi:hypothetical protein
MIKNNESSRNELFIIFFGILLFFTLNPKAHGTPVGQSRVLKLMTYPFAPVEIMGIKVKDTPVSFNQPLSDDKDWINGITVRVKNISEKSISYISIELRSEPPESGDKPRITSVSSGVLPLLRDGAEQQANILISPDMFIDITLSNDQYQVYKDYLQVSSLQVSVGSVFFTDDTLWMKGVSFTRDSKNPNNWKPVKTSVKSVEEFYLQNRKQGFMQSPGKALKSFSPTLQLVANKLATKSRFSMQDWNCHILSDAQFWPCDYQCPDFYVTYIPPYEFGRWDYYEVYANCSGPNYCYPYQIKLDVRLCFL